MKVKLFFLGFLFLVMFSALSFFLYQRNSGGFISPLAEKEKDIKEKPLDKYTFSNLRKTPFSSSKIEIGKQLKDEENFSSYVFYYYDNGKKVSGLLNIPKEKGVYPVIVMFRGYVDKSIYTIGEGSKRAGEVFAQNGFVTVAPDFLGYGESDNPSENSMEERFQTYTTALSLLASIKNISLALEKENIEVHIDSSKVAIWGHSNGGHISLSVLGITKKPYPTVLWAAVTKSFPYSILYYTDEFEDHGKALRKVLADFENDYDVEKYSLANYFDPITAPILFFQGESDDAVPRKWSEDFFGLMKEKDKDIEYVEYPGADHNLMPTGWSDAVSKSIEFYKTRLK